MCQRSLERTVHFGDCLKSFLRILGGSLENHMLNGLRNLRITLAGGRERLVDVLEQIAHRSIRRVRQAPCRQLEENDPEGVLIGSTVNRPPLNLFGRHVGRSADHRRSSQAFGGFDKPSHSEIRQQRVALRVKQNVRGLDVSMHHAVLVCVGQGGRDLVEQSASHLERYRTLFNPVGETADLEEGHHLIGISVLLAVVQNRNNIGMIQPRHHVHLAAKAPDELLGLSQRGADELNGHFLVGPAIARAIHRGHTPTADAFMDLIIAKNSSG